jgi:hypothetical protein
MNVQKQVILCGPTQDKSSVVSRTVVLTQLENLCADISCSDFNDLNVGSLRTGGLPLGFLEINYI